MYDMFVGILDQSLLSTPDSRSPHRESTNSKPFGLLQVGMGWWWAHRSPPLVLSQLLRNCLWIAFTPGVSEDYYLWGHPGQPPSTLPIIYSARNSQHWQPPIYLVNPCYSWWNHWDSSHQLSYPYCPQSPVSLWHLGLVWSTGNQSCAVSCKVPSPWTDQDWPDKNAK